MQIWFDLLLYLAVLCKYKSLFPGFWVQKGWLVVPDRVLSSEVEESLSGGVFSSNEISRLEGVMLRVFISQERSVKRLLYQSGFFLIEAIRHLHIGVLLLLSFVSQKNDESNVLNIL